MRTFRFLKVTTFYQIFLQQFYARRSELQAVPYGEQYRTLMDDCFGWSDFFAKNLKKLGNEAIEIVANAEPLQKQWAREHDVSFSDESWIEEILAAQIRNYNPDVLFWEDTSTFGTKYRQTIRTDNPGVHLHIGWRCSPTTDYSCFQDLDLMVLCNPAQATRLREEGVTTALLNHAFEPSILDRIEAAPRSLEFIFAGSLNRAHHSTRYKLVESLIRYTPLQVWTGLASTMRSQSSVRSMAKKLTYSIVGDLVNAGIPFPFLDKIPFVNRVVRRSGYTSSLPLAVEFPGRLHPQVFGMDMFRLLAQSKIVFNSHINAAGDFAGNMRLFEASGMGALLLTDWKSNLPTLFEPDVEVVGYRNLEECIEKVQYLLNHEEEREAIAHAGQQRTLREHTYYHRMQELVDIVKRFL